MASNKHIINFGAGPAAIPAEVLAKAAKSIMDYQESGLSILELPHRSHALFQDILAESKRLVCQLCALDPEEYEVLWLQGGGRMQFTMIPMNFLASDATAAYIDSGYWAHDAMQHAKDFGKVEVLASSRDTAYTTYPKIPLIASDRFSYLHFTTNNTIYGTQIQDLPDVKGLPLIADMSSDIFSVPRDYTRFDMFYAVAQKNIGAAGNTLVVIRKRLLDKIVRKLSPILDYSQHVKAGSVLNTPPVFGIYLSLLMLQDIEARGLDYIYKENKEKAALLYLEIERNSLFETSVCKEDRSITNVVFSMAISALQDAFKEFALETGIFGIEGHRSVGGFRVSLYNAITLDQVKHLVEVMQQFEQKINTNS